MADKDQPKRDYSAGARALLKSVLPNTIFDSIWIIQFCYQCKNANCKKLYPLETGVHTIERERVEEKLGEFAKGFEEPRTIECPACHFVAEYHPKDIGFDVLEKPEK
jgi:hypothetical protein